MVPSWSATAVRHHLKTPSGSGSEGHVRLAVRNDAAAAPHIQPATHDLAAMGGRGAAALRRACVSLGT